MIKLQRCCKNASRRCSVSILCTHEHEKKNYGKRKWWGVMKVVAARFSSSSVALGSRAFVAAGQEKNYPREQSSFAVVVPAGLLHLATTTMRRLLLLLLHPSANLYTSSCDHRHPHSSAHHTHCASRPSSCSRPSHSPPRYPRTSTASCWGT